MQNWVKAIVFRNPYGPLNQCLSTPLHIIEGQLGRKKIQNSLFAYFFQLPSRLPSRDFSSKEKELDSEMK